MKIWQSRKLYFAVAAFAVAAMLTLATFWAWACCSATQSLTQAQRVRNLKALYVALVCYSERNGGLPPARMSPSSGESEQSWRVLLLPFLDQDVLYSAIDLKQPWDSPTNKRQLDRMPEYYRSPVAAEKLSTNTNYFAVVGSLSPWWGTEGSKPWNAPGSEEIMLIELPTSETPWMKPFDPTLDELLDMLRPEYGNGASVGGGTDVLYLTVRGDVRVAPKNASRQLLRRLFFREQNAVIGPDKTYPGQMPQRIATR